MLPATPPVVACPWCFLPPFFSVTITTEYFSQGAGRIHSQFFGLFGRKVGCGCHRGGGGVTMLRGLPTSIPFLRNRPSIRTILATWYRVEAESPHMWPGLPITSVSVPDGVIWNFDLSRHVPTPPSALQADPERHPWHRVPA